MTTFLLALTTAVNIDHDLRTVQTAIFRRYGDPSALLLPPLIPIAGGPTAKAESCPEALLDTIRKAHPVSISEVAENEKPRPMLYDGVLLLPVALAGWEALREACTTLADTVLADRNERTHREDSPVFRTDTPSFHLAWDTRNAFVDAEAIASELHETIPTMPKTAAFWLTAFEIEHGPDLWWDGSVYQIVYRRRLSVPR